MAIETTPKRAPENPANVARRQRKRRQRHQTAARLSGYNSVDEWAAAVIAGAENTARTGSAEKERA